MNSALRYQNRRPVWRRFFRAASGLLDMFCNKIIANPNVIRRKFLAVFTQQTTSHAARPKNGLLEFDHERVIHHGSRSWHNFDDVILRRRQFHAETGSFGYIPKVGLSIRKAPH